LRVSATSRRRLRRTVFIRSMIMICDASSPVFPELFAV
jgi:hypothetical protein